MKRSRWFALALLLALAGCVAPAAVKEPLPPHTGRLLLYLERLPQEAHLLTFSVAGVAALRDDGTEVSLGGPLPALKGETLAGGQTRLLSAFLAPGRYRGLALRPGEASLRTEEGQAALLWPREPIFLDQAFTVAEGEAVTLFLTLGAERLVTDGVRFTPRFALWTPRRVLVNLKGFVSNTTADSLTVIEKRTPKVVGTIATGAGPEGLALDRARGWAYVALAGADAVAAVEVGNSVILGSARLRSGDRPTEVALTPSGRILVVADSGATAVSVVDTSSLAEVARVRLPSEPTDVFTGPSEGRAYVLEATSNRLTALDLSPGNRVRLSSVVLEETPVRGAVSRDGRSLYLVTGFSPNLLVVDAATLVVRQRIYVGGGGLCLVVDRARGLVYVGKRSGEIDVVDPTSGVLIDALTAPGPVAFLAIDREEDALFAVLPEQRSVHKFDLVSRRFRGSVTVDAGAHAIVVMGER